MASELYLATLRWRLSRRPHYDLFTRAPEHVICLRSCQTGYCSSYSLVCTNLRWLADPVHGLFGASVQPMVYAMLGTCAQLSVGPEAALSLLIGQTISQVTTKIADPSEVAHIAVAVTGLITFQVGAITFLLGLFRGGFLDAVLSRPLLRGFVTAVGVVILVEQLIPILGLQALEKASGVDRGSIPQKMVFILRNLTHTHWLTFGVASVTLAILVLYRLAKPGLIKRYDRLKYVPEVLLAVVSTTSAFCLLDNALVLILQRSPYCCSTLGSSWSSDPGPCVSRAVCTCILA